MSNETKIGLLAVIAIAISIWGYKFIRGKNLLVTSNVYYVEYQNIEGLKMSSPVLINGFQVGIVADIYLKPDNYDIIVVKLDLDKDIKVPKTTVARIIATGFMGGTAVRLDYDQLCNGDSCAKSGDYLRGEALGMLASMLGKQDIEDYVNILKEGLQGVLDSLNSSVTGDPNSPVAKMMTDLQATMANLRSTTGQLNGLLAKSSSNIAGTMENLNNMTAEDGELQSILGSTDSLTSQLAAMDLQKTMKEIEETITGLQTTLEAANGTLAGVTTTMDKINKGEGTLGMLMTDEALYQRLSSLSIKADSLLNDFQAKPYRYMPLKSRKKVKKFDRQDAAQGN